MLGLIVACNLEVWPVAGIGQLGSSSVPTNWIPVIGLSCGLISTNFPPLKSVAGAPLQDKALAWTLNEPTQPTCQVIIPVVGWIVPGNVAVELASGVIAAIRYSTDE